MRISCTYRESYFGDMVDVLNLNPAKVKKMLLENDVKCYGSFPNYKHREGKELVSYADFWQELQNSLLWCKLISFCGQSRYTRFNRQQLRTERNLQKDFTIKLGSPSFGLVILSTATVTNQGVSILLNPLSL